MIAKPPVIVLAVSALLLFVLSRMVPALSEWLFQLSPIMLVATAIGQVPHMATFISRASPNVSIAMGTSIALVGGYCLPYAVAGVVAIRARTLSFLVGTVVPIALFVLPSPTVENIVHTLMAFLIALPFLAVFYCLGVALQRRIVRGEKGA